MREWIYGRNPVWEVLRAGRREAFRLRLAQGIRERDEVVARILSRCRKLRLPVERTPRQKLDKITHHHQGVLLEVSPYSYVQIDDALIRAAREKAPPLLLVLDTLQDPQNLGALLRTAEIVGVHGVLLPLRQTVNITPAVVAASSGASEHLSVIKVNLAQGLRRLKEAGVFVIGLDGGSQSMPLSQINLDCPLALVVGNEGQGMRRLVRETCDQLLQLPMRGQIESLNAAIAGSVALYLAWQARGFPTGP